MWPNPQESADLGTLTEEILNKNFLLCAMVISPSALYLEQDVNEQGILE